MRGQCQQCRSVPSEAFPLIVFHKQIHFIFKYLFAKHSKQIGLNFYLLWDFNAIYIFKTQVLLNFCQCAKISIFPPFMDTLRGNILRHSKYFVSTSLLHTFPGSSQNRRSQHLSQELGSRIKETIQTSPNRFAPLRQTWFRISLWNQF